MYRIIIIDDEPQIRKGLCSIIDWAEYGVEIVGEAANGIEALELIKEHHPDIVLTDIAMPVLDGLQLIEKMNQLPNIPKVIILSGFDTFEYVRKSLRLGANNYLLKPVDSEELQNTLSEVITSIDATAEKKFQFQESMQILRNNTLNRLLRDKIGYRELQEKCELLDITLRSNNMRIGILRPILDSCDSESEWPVYPSIELCMPIMNQYVQSYLVIDSNDNIVIILKNEKNKYKDASLLSLLNNCASKIKSEFGISCLVSLGPLATSYKDIPSSYEKALKMLDFKQAWGDKNFDVSSILLIHDTVVAAFDPSILSEYIEQRNGPELTRAIHSFFADTLPSQNILDPMVIKYHLTELVTCAMQTVRKCHVAPADIHIIEKKTYALVNSSLSMKNIEAEMCKLMDFIMDRVESVSSGSYSLIVQNAVRYIQQNYIDINLSLKTLSNQMNVNAAYLGRRFSLETGEYFSNYLNNIRIRSAQKLLNTTSLKASEIAEIVGFANISYFYTVYKKILGQSPSNDRM